jgi:hypothetical protein
VHACQSTSLLISAFTFFVKGIKLSEPLGQPRMHKDVQCYNLKQRDTKKRNPFPEGRKEDFSVQKETSINFRMVFVSSYASTHKKYESITTTRFINNFIINNYFI